MWWIRLPSRSPHPVGSENGPLEAGFSSHDSTKVDERGGRMAADRWSRRVLLDTAGIRAVQNTEAVRLFSDPSIGALRELLSRVYFKPHPYSDSILEQAASMNAKARTWRVNSASVNSIWVTCAGGYTIWSCADAPYI